MEKGTIVQSQKISAFVICYNRADVLGTCLRSLRFADELIVVDKSSTDASRLIAEGVADHVVMVPWSATVETSRGLALSLCKHDWILFADDDECLSAGSGRQIRDEVAAPQAEIYEFALRHYILGRHDERAYYWPEHHVRLFRRGAVTFVPTVHGGIDCHSTRRFSFPHTTGISIHHLSNPDVNGWIEKTNRYTSSMDRVGVCPDDREGLSVFAHKRIDHWLARTGNPYSDGYLEAAALLRAVYDMIDALKVWEAANDATGAERLQDIARQLDIELCGAR